MSYTFEVFMGLPVSFLASNDSRINTLNDILCQMPPSRHIFCALGRHNFPNNPGYLPNEATMVSDPVATTLESSSTHSTTRRKSSARQGSMLMFRRSSFSSACLQPARDSSLDWANGSFAHIKTNSSLEVRDGQDDAIRGLLKEIHDVIMEQTKRKGAMDHQMNESMTLAKARYLSGSRIGAILSMRKAHKHKSIKAYISAARYQLKALRKDVEAALLEDDSKLNVDKARKIMKEILAELTLAKFEKPDDDDLMKQLERTMLLEASSGECRARAA